MTDRNQTIVIGIGNTLRGDDGAGAFVARRFAEFALPNVQSLEVHQLLPELAPVISTVKRVIFVDATPSIESDAVPLLRRTEAVEFSPSLTHQSHPAQLLSLIEFWPDRIPEAWIVTIPVAHMSVGEGLSECARKNSDLAIRMILDLLGNPDCTIEENS